MRSNKNVLQKHSTQTNHRKLTPALNSRRLKSCLSKSNYLLLKLTNLLASIVSAPGFLKDAAIIIAPTLTDIFSQSLKSTFPKIFKEGKVTPIFKSGDCTNMSNYRPITVLPILSKILERFVHTQIYNYLTENKILSPNQFGFRLVLLWLFSPIIFSKTLTTVL